MSPAPPAGGTAATGSFVRANRQRTIVPRGERPGAVEQVDDGQHVRGVAHTAAIDVLVTPEGQDVFLEISPAGEFFWGELNPGFPISEAISDVLLNRARRREQDLHTFAPQPLRLQKIGRGVKSTIAFADADAWGDVASGGGVVIAVFAGASSRFRETSVSAKGRDRGLLASGGAECVCSCRLGSRPEADVVAHFGQS